MIFSEIDEFVIMQREYRRTIRHAKNIHVYPYHQSKQRESHFYDKIYTYKYSF